MENETVKRHERSAGYPAISLEEAIKFSELLNKAFGKSSFAREDGVKAMGYSTITGTSAPRLAALAHYGLVDKAGGGYKNSDLSIKILKPTTDNERMGAIKEAVKHPKLFADLISAYAGGSLPEKMNFILERSHGINGSKLAEKVAETFRDSIKFARIYENGILNTSSNLTFSESSDLKEAETIALEKNEKNKGNDKNPEIANNVNQTMAVSSAFCTVPLPNKITISYPLEMAFCLQTNSKYAEALILLAAVKVDDVEE